jgi:hypothetical protein
MLLMDVPGFAAEQPEIVCIQCHGAMTGRLGEPVALWRGSIHAENGIFCNGCHGGDPKDMANAMSPTRGFLGKPHDNDIPAFCGRCHVGVLAQYRDSAHGRALGRGGPTCVTCHGNHLVKKATLALINEKSCSRCHPFERARLIKEAMSAVETRIEVMGQRISRYQEQGVDTKTLAQRLFAARNRFHTLAHLVAVTKIQGQTQAINAELDAINNALKAIDELDQQKKIVGAAAIALALFAALLLRLYRKTLD